MRVHLHTAKRYGGIKRDSRLSLQFIKARDRRVLAILPPGVDVAEGRKCPWFDIIGLYRHWMGTRVKTGFQRFTVV
jgi:hypothetical protein